VSLVKAALVAIEKRRMPSDLAIAMSGHLIAGSAPLRQKIVVDNLDVSVNVETRANGEINEIGLWFRSKQLVRLADLLPILGTDNEAVESKTSSVKFRRPAPGVRAYAHLLSSKVFPNAVVSGVELRSDTESTQDTGSP
jgi:hypothetical protein